MGNIFNKIKINIASPEKILSWSHGEVQLPDTINYRTLKPVTNGLFDERIFGPIKDYTCSCGKYRSAKIPGKVCEKCGVELTTSLSRRERMGHVTLNTPIVHSYYYKGQTSIIGSLLGVKSKDITDVVLHNKYLVLEDFKDTIDGEPLILHKNTVIVESEYRRIRNASKGKLKAQMGGEGVKYALEHLDIDELIEELNAKKEKTKQEAEIKKINKRLTIANELKESGNKPEWMVMDYLPILPPDLRPMTQTQNAKFAVADLNELYKNVIVRNNRLGELLDNAFTPEVIRRNERRLLQLSVDALINNEEARNKKSGKKEYKSLTENLKGKHGRLRQNLLGKRVDYSGRSVITIEPSLNMNQCGLPKDMAMELFKPMVCSKLLENGDAINIKKATSMIKEGNDLAWDALAEVIKDYPVLLNRAPTLHRLGIQAFQPILVEGKSIRLHPLVCTAFNADFDGDQMAVHVPLSLEAQAECKALMNASGNLLKPSDGTPIAVPSQDMVLGVYYLTMKNDTEVDQFSNLFKDVNEALLAYENKKIKLQDPIKVRREVVNKNGEVISGIINTTLGRCIFNDIIPQDIGIIERNTDEDLVKLEVDYLVGKKQLKQLLKAVIDKHGIEKASKFLDDVKNMGYKYSTKAAITVSISDMIVPESKEEILEDAEKEVQLTKDDYMSGFLTEEERHKQTLNIWKKADGQIKDELLSGLGEYNNIFIMANSGARGSEDQIKQLAGMRGNMSATGNKVIELPIKSNFREGLNVLEYFISAHGARKALSDTALKTADAGYLTRRLVDLSQELIITEWDCSENEEIPYTEINEIKEFGNQIESLESRIIGKFLAEDKGIYKKNTLITPSIAKTLTKDNDTLKIRTPRSCKSKNGICCKCYGTNLATGEIAEIGDAVGVIAAQSIGEPGTQLTMRTFHTGGIATGDDITTGLPRVEEIFEARNPKGEAILAPIDGYCSIIYDNDNTYIEITSDTEAVKVDIPFIKKSVITVKDGEYIKKGTLLTKGSANLNSLMQIAGKNAVEEYVIKEIQNVYKGRGVDINDKHIEVMLKSMFRNVSITNPGDTNLSIGDELSLKEVISINENLDADKEPAQYENILYGLTKAVQKSSKSFLSAASSRETKNVLSRAAFRGEEDTLDDIKSNVIIGSLIPAGTGLV